MKNNIKATGLELTPAINSYLSEKLADVERFLNSQDQSVHASVEVGKTTAHHKHGDVFRAEIRLHAAGQDLYAASEADDLYAAIDNVKDEIIAEIKTKKEKKNTLLRRGGRRLKNMLRSINPWSK